MYIHTVIKELPNPHSKTLTLKPKKLLPNPTLNPHFQARYFQTLARKPHWATPKPLTSVRAPQAPNPADATVKGHFESTGSVARAIPPPVYPVYPLELTTRKRH